MPTSGGAVTPESDLLNGRERRQLDIVRRWGTIGALLLTVGSLGGGAAPIYSPLYGVPVLGLFSRMPSVAMGVVWTGIFMIVSAWLALGRFVKPGRPRLISRGQMDRTLLMWTVPLVFCVPMFSRDVYSYLAQSEIAARGLDPYELGPANALGVDHVLTRGVPNIWRETPAPYGPLFLAFGRLTAMLTGDHVVSGVFVHRLLVLVGLGMIVWALPRLAARFGVPPVGALWLGALNPLVLFHIVIGVHNDGLALGLMLVGLELAMRGLEPLRWTWISLGAVVIVCGAMVKIPAMAALGFLGVMVARKLGGQFKHLALVAGIMAGIAAVGVVVICLGTGFGFGWVETLNVASTVKSWMSPPTALGFLGAGTGILLGLGNHTEAMISLTRLLGQAVSVVITVGLLWRSFKGRIKAMNGLGAALGAILVLGPVLQPWYVLWAAIPLATAVVGPKFRMFAMVTSAIIAIILPPTGSAFDGRAYTVPQAVAGAVITFAICVLIARKRVGPFLKSDPAGGGHV
ncbi:polyprenol phosphomannose-dependent alpha 1,6 mannosyltransferase MptB [Lentzea pudingi]|uniref:polyprenol phosphomannose-dependent alpha 1,6 mannosyltransferase MptB n=1 Tax=Lentzea pudingi TaxID=1789439 RepID=UPI00166B78F0|nr:polyprenol phosphomannose-dependent alpha 1,6 mannosyltransferase MptB [Lentzea pudingi]